MYRALVEHLKDIGRRWKPIHLCWLFRALGLPVPRYFVATTDPVFDQESFRFRNDDGSESGATWYAILNADVNDLDNDTNYRLRINVKEQNTAVGKNEDIQFQYSHESGAWTNITTTSSYIKAIASADAGFSHLGNTTQQLTSGGFDATNAACSETGVSGGATLDPPQDSYVEAELCFQVVSADVVAGETIDIRVLFDLALDTWTQVPRITVAVAATTHYLSGSADSVSLLSGKIGVTRDITGTADSITLLSGALGITQQIVGSADSVTLLSGDLTVTTKHLLSGSADSVSLLSGGLRFTHGLSGSADSASLLSGAIDLDIKLIGSTDSMSLLSASLGVIRPLAGSADSVSLLSGTVHLTRGLAGSADSDSMLSGEIRLVRSLGGAAGSISLLSGSCDVAIKLAGSADSVSLLSGTLTTGGVFVPMVVSITVEEYIDVTTQVADFIKAPIIVDDYVEQTITVEDSI